MFAKKKVLLLTGLLLALALLAGAPDASAHPEEACHYWLPWQGAHNIEEGDDVCFYVNFLWPTKGLLNHLTKSFVIDVTMVDGDGQTICERDCDDDNIGAFSGASEVCDGADTNCDGAVDNITGESGSWRSCTLREVALNDVDTSKLDVEHCSITPLDSQKDDIPDGFNVLSGRRKRV